MSAKPLAIEGFVQEPTLEEGSDWRKERQRLEEENRSLRRDLEDAIEEKERMARTIKNLRTILSPVHNGLRMIFGEIELAVGEETFAAATNHRAEPNQKADPKWEHYKQQFPGVPAKIIDVLLIHGDVRIAHLPSLVHAARKTVYNAGDKLALAGAIVRTGGLWSLKR